MLKQRMVQRNECVLMKKNIYSTFASPKYNTSRLGLTHLIGATCFSEFVNAVIFGVGVFLTRELSESANVLGLTVEAGTSSLIIKKSTWL